MSRGRATGSGGFPRWFPRSLRRQLLLGVLAVVSVVLVTVGIVSVLSLRGYVNTMSDADVAESLDALSHQYTKYRNGEHTSAHPGTPPIAQAMLEFTGQTPGNLIAVLRDGVVIGSAVFSEVETKPAPDDVVRALEAQSWPGGPPRTEILGRLGSYRVDSTIDGSDVLVVGVSQNLADRIIARKQLTTIALTAAALALTAGLTVWVVGLHASSAAPARGESRPMSPSCRSPTTTTASASGCNHRTPTRSNEVGIVGHTLNRLLDNVDSALAHRADSDLRMRQFISRRQPRVADPAGGHSGLRRAHPPGQFGAATDHRIRAGPNRIRSSADGIARRRVAAAVPTG